MKWTHKIKVASGLFIIFFSKSLRGTVCFHVLNVRSCTMLRLYATDLTAVYKEHFRAASTPDAISFSAARNLCMCNIITDFIKQRKNTHTVTSEWIFINLSSTFTKSSLMLKLEWVESSLWGNICSYYYYYIFLFAVSGQMKRVENVFFKPDWTEHTWVQNETIGMPPHDAFMSNIIW